jgi:hypothetical protein
VLHQGAQAAAGSAVCPNITKGAAVLKAKSFTIDGEAVVVGPDGLTDFEALRRRGGGEIAVCSTVARAIGPSRGQAQSAALIAPTASEAPSSAASALSATNSIAASSASDGVPTHAAPRGYLPYSNPQFHFALSYPANLQLQEYKEAGGAFTVTFQDIVADEEFQVYVTPYSGTEITDAQFKLDEPSGVKIDPTDVTVAGASGIEFFSYAPRLDDTREVWFIHGGFLYEVTTYKNFDAWLQSWRFI